MSECQKVRIHNSECRGYHRNSIASIQGTTADQSQFHETYASPSVQGRENLSKNIRPPANEIYVIGERKADGISVRMRRKTIYFRDSEDISLALCHCQWANLQFTA